MKIATRAAYGKALAALGEAYPDLVVLDKDIFTCDPMQIKDIKCDMTIIDGDVVFERK